MRVCDRHPDKRSRTEVIFVLDDQHFDLCAECEQEMLQFIGTPEKIPVKSKRSRKAKR